MLKQTLYTGIGAAALTVDFVTNPKQGRDWLKKAGRRGSKIAARGQLRLRKLSKGAQSALGELGPPPLATVGLAPPKTPPARSTAAPRPAAKARPARRRAPRARTTRPAAQAPTLTVRAS